MEATDSLLLQLKLVLKQKIMEALLIECKLPRTELYKNLITKLHIVIQAQLLMENSDRDPPKILATLITHN